MTFQQSCERIDICGFFIYEMKVESIAHRFKDRYCHSCKEACAIYMVFSSCGDANIPRDLYPNEYDRALDILSKKPQ